VEAGDSRSRSFVKVKAAYRANAVLQKLELRTFEWGAGIKVNLPHRAGFKKASKATLELSLPNSSRACLGRSALIGQYSANLMYDSSNGTTAEVA
jgi:hypothetical protein